MKKRALISVSDKEGIVEFCKNLIELDYEIISTGGTKKLLDENNISNKAIEAITDFPEILAGRVKTLHPIIHGGLLGILDNQEHIEVMKKHNIEPINLVCVNLYPFKETVAREDCTFELAIENIDIGGPSMLRSAAKNHKFVTVICDKKDYSLVINELKQFNETTLDTRKYLAYKVFKLTAGYDNMIQNYLSKFVKEEQEVLSLNYNLKQELRYGENPHQKAKFYSDGLNYRYSLSNAQKLHGKELSYNNIQDGNAALEILKEFGDKPCVVALKHMNPCGVAMADNIYEAMIKAYEGDPISIFGGIVAFNQEVDEKCAEFLSGIFLEIILAPSFSEKALKILSKKKNIRLIIFETKGDDPKDKLVSITGGLLIQNSDHPCEYDLKVVTKRKPTPSEIENALFAMKVVKHVKSNAIVLVKDFQSIGIGAGQMNRVGACKIACEMADVKANESILASDAFFPMSDSVVLAGKYGISCIIQPGGSIKDQESIDMCDKLNIAMIFTGRRHFKH